jgi:hypothetical protein
MASPKDEQAAPVADDPRLCACGAALRGRSNTECRKCVRLAAMTRRETVRAEVGRTGLTERASSITARVGAASYRDLAAMMKRGEVARVGRRYFPAAWLRHGGCDA